MKASFAGGVLHSTDYFSSRDYEEGRAWLVMHLTDWHVLLPDTPACNAARPQHFAQRCGQVATAGRCHAARSPARNASRSDAGGLACAPCCRSPTPAPSAPARMATLKRCWRALTLYTSELHHQSGQSVDSPAPRRVGAKAPDVPSVSKASKPSAFGFGSLQPGLQIYRTCPHGYAKRPARIATRSVAGGCWRACRLWLVRDTRRGEKAHDQQRRLER